MQLQPEERVPAVAPMPAPRPRLATRLRHWRDAVLPRRASAPAPKKNFTATLREWHKRAGLAACLFLGWLACSGVLLTRSQSLGFDVERVDWPWLMSLYGLKPEPPRSGFADHGHWLAAAKTATLLDGKPIAQKIESPLGFVSIGDARYVATQESVVVLDASGKTTDELRSPFLPVSTVRRIGVVAGTNALAVQDLDAYRSDDGGNNWSTVAPNAVQWSAASPLSDPQRAALTPYSRPSVLVEQLLIDLHSGRLFGPVGAWVITIVGFGALWLAISGSWMWWRIQKARRKR
ncbi:MAG TPA: PepSY-associated TM helix domain-containing protein [Nevskiaceae bacterium]|nr:PepSY-associated TM helix domain-containing protein [Nevskiaceae bacterium]